MANIENDVQPLYKKDFSYRLFLQGILNTICYEDIDVNDYILNGYKDPHYILKFAMDLGYKEDIIGKINLFCKLYDKYSIPYSKEKMLKDIPYMVVDGYTYKITETDLDDCETYLKNNNRIICEYNMRNALREHVFNIFGINTKRKGK